MNIKFVSANVNNNIKGCNQCMHWECGDGDVGVNSGCSHPILYDDEDNLSDELNDLIIAAIDDPNHCVLFVKNQL